MLKKLSCSMVSSPEDIPLLKSSRKVETAMNNGVYVNLVDGVIWVHEVVGSNPATPTCG